LLHLVGINTFECMKMHGLANPKITKLIVTFRIFTNAFENEWWRLEVLVIQLTSITKENSFAPEHYAQSATS